MATWTSLSSYEKKMLRRREREERKLSYNLDSRILDRRDPVEDNFDDERTDDLNFVEQGCVTPAFELSGDPDLEDNLDDRDDAEEDEDDDRPADRYEEMAERLGIDNADDAANDSLHDVVSTSSWEEFANDPRTIKVPVLKNRADEDIVVEKSFIKMVNDNLEHESPRKEVGSWKQTTTQAAQYLRHTWRGVHRIDTVRGTAPVTDDDGIDLTLGEIEALRDTPAFDDESLRYRLLGPDYDDDFIDLGPIIKNTGSPAYY